MIFQDDLLFNVWSKSSPVKWKSLPENNLFWNSQTHFFVILGQNGSWSEMQIFDLEGEDLLRMRRKESFSPNSKRSARESSESLESSMKHGPCHMIHVVRRKRQLLSSSLLSSSSFFYFFRRIRIDKKISGVLKL